MTSRFFLFRNSTKHLAQLFLLLVCTGFSAAVTDQPTVTDLEADLLSLPEAGSLFAKNNLELIADRLKIRVAEAQRVQAELWQNPNLQIGQNIYNPDTKKYFDVTKTGNTDIAITQTLRLGGKRSSEIKIADIDLEISKTLISEALRVLHHELRVSFYRLYFQQKMLRFYDRSIESLRNTAKLTEKSYANRSILLTEVLRVKAILTGLLDQRMDLVADMAQSKTRLASLIWGRDISKHQNIVPTLDEAQIEALQLPLSLSDALEAARRYRADVKIQQLGYNKEQIKTRLEEANAIPDLSVGLQYSRAGSYIPEYYAVTFGIDLPVFNRNQGRVAAQKYTAQASAVEREKADVDLQSTVTGLYQTAMSFDQAFRDIDRSFIKDYEKLAEQTVANYQKRNISVIAFADFYESYQETLVRLNEIQMKRLNAFEDLNQAIGKIVVGI